MNRFFNYPSYLTTRYFFLRGLGVGLFLSFVSWSVQIIGLIGPDGILPARDVFSGALERFSFLAALIQVPSLFWISQSEGMIYGVLFFGVIGSVLLAFNVVPKIGVLFAFVSYLSIISVSEQFGSIQADTLLLETTFLAIFIAPRGWRPQLGEKDPISLPIKILVFWLMFRLMFESGITKWLFDPSWRDLTAMSYYYQSAPIPTPIAWYLQYLPMWFHKLTSAYTLFVEIGGGLLIFGSKKMRHVAVFMWIVLHLGILSTGNYSFLNYNAILLSLLLVGDFNEQGSVTPSKGTWFFVGVVFVYSILQFFLMFPSTRSLFSQDLVRSFRIFDRLRIVNSYYFFRTMKSDRYLIQFEGSNDNGKTWRPYLYKGLSQTPFNGVGLIAPHTPRLDCIVSFAGYSTIRSYPLINYVAIRLLQEKKEVVSLFKNNPFPLFSPDRIRVRYFQVVPVSIDVHKKTGEWWSFLYIDDYTSQLLINKHASFF